MRTVIFITSLTALFLFGCGPSQTGMNPDTASGDPILFASQKAAKSVAWYRLDGTLLKEVPVSHHPHEIVTSTDGKTIYVTDNGVMQIENAGQGGNKISIIDLESRERIGEIDLGKWHRPHGIDLCPDGTLLVTSENPDQLLVIDVDKRTIIQEWDTGGQTPHIVRAGRNSKYAYVSNARSRTVAKIDLKTGERQLLETGDRPEGSILSADGGQLYVVHRNADKIAVIDTESWKVLGEITTGKEPVRIGVAGDGTTLVYGMLGGEAVGFADLNTMQETHQIPVEGRLVSLEMMEDGVTALTCAQFKDICYLIDVPSKTIRQRLKINDGAGPDPARLLPSN